MFPSKKIVIIWLSITAITVIVQITLGGYVRLTDSGLSIYDWHVVDGIVPPLTSEGWQTAFDGYKNTPEYQKINVGMNLAEYKNIYFREYNHRILGRITGLIFVLPLFLFLFFGRFKWRTSKVYLVTGLLYAGQGVLGWYMVKSGLVDAPHVSHFRLAAHLLLAFLIIGLVFWKLFDTIFEEAIIRKWKNLNSHFKISVVFIALLAVQICWGAFMAGLKAGAVSNTFPLMLGYLIPPNLIDPSASLIGNLIGKSMAVHFTHRWFAFVVLAYTFFVYLKFKNISKTALFLLLATGLQILAGILVIWLRVDVSMALVHQAGAVVLLFISLFLAHKSIHKK